MRYLVRADLRGAADGDGESFPAKEKKYEEQTEGNGWIDWGVRCGHGGDDGLVWMGCGRLENAGGEGPGAASYRAECHQPGDYGRGHHFAATRFAGKENAGNWAEYVPFRYGGAKVLACLQPLREGLAGSEQPEVCAVEAVRTDVVNDDGPGCGDLCAELAGGGRASAGVAGEVCAAGEPGAAGKEGGNVFSIGSATEHDHRPAIVFADPLGKSEGVQFPVRSRSGIIRSDEANRDLANTGTWFVGLRVSEGKTSEIHCLAAPLRL